MDLPEGTPEDCPECGAELNPTIVFLDDGEPVAIVLECEKHTDGSQVKGYTYVAEPVLYELHEKPKPIPWNWE